MAKKGRKPRAPRKPKKAKAEPREAFPKEEILDETEECLVVSGSDRRAARELARRTNLSTRHAERYVRYAIERFKLEGETDPVKRAEKRSVLKAKVKHVYELAINRGYTFTKKNGTVVRKIDADSKGAIAALQFEALLDNLLAPDVAEDPKDVESSEQALLALAAKHFGMVIDTQGETVEAPALPPEGEASEAP